RKLLWVYGLCLPLRAISIMMTMGLLRGGGDTTFAFLVESSTIWLVGVPAVLISALVFKGPFHYVVAFTYLEQVAKGIACLIRFTRGKWIHNLVEQPLQP
ncbi:MAG: MATE family efflux transporter, partial [Clostridiales bacterium]